MPASRADGLPTEFSHLTYMFGNYATSSYHALQARFQRHFSDGLAAIASYTWSHSIDTGSVNASIPAQAVPTAAILASAIPFNLVKASSDFDIRQALGVSLVYDIPTPFAGNRFASAVLGQWSVDPIYHYQTAVPVDVFANNTGTLGGATGLSQRPNLIPGVPVYVYGADCTAQRNGQGCPGGVGFNVAPVSTPVAAANGCIAPTAANAKGAFCTPMPIGGQAVSGNLGRNVLRGFPLQEFDLSVHRDFPFRERFRLRFQSDMFNLFNHPQFGPEGGLISGSSFGLATAMANSSLGAAVNSGAGFNPIFNTRGPRNLQFAMKLFF